MRGKVSSRGLIALSEPFRRRLRIRVGDILDASIVAGRIVLKPHKKRRGRAYIITDPLTGLPVLTAGPGSPVLTSKEVEEMLASFP